MFERNSTILMISLGLTSFWIKYILNSIPRLSSMYYNVNTNLLKYLQQYMDKSGSYEQKVSKGVHRTNNQIDIFNNGNSKGRFEQTSQTAETKYLLPAGKNWARGNTLGSNGGTVSGGILKQFIQETDDQLAESIARTEKLQKRKQQLIELFYQLSEKTGESLEGINPASKDANNLEQKK